MDLLPFLKKIFLPLQLLNYSIIINFLISLILLSILEEFPIFLNYIYYQLISLFHNPSYFLLSFLNIKLFISWHQIKQIIMELYYIFFLKNLFFLLILLISTVKMVYLSLKHISLNVLKNQFLQILFLLQYKKIFHLFLSLLNFYNFSKQYLFLTNFSFL